ncbi:MAG: DUF1294 domain-containing protein [Defluviitaleaceae bacterium]|nr:DUF1294 domain-containing protein [Defluviitaleaceae bacterium]
MLELIVVLVIWNILVFILYGIDKRRAVKGKWRISENMLLTCAFIAGGIGAFMGMMIFRHKTKNIKFKTFVPLALVINIAAAVFVYGERGIEENVFEQEPAYIRITPSEAREMMHYGEDVVILDVRTAEEFADGHIAGAVLLPSNVIEAGAGEVIPDRGQTILVYCRSGARSAAAARILIEMGYTAVYDFGGIMDWSYEIVR